MTQKNITQSTLREYFTACFLAVLTSFAGLTESDGMPGRGLWLVGLAAILIAGFVYFQFKKQGEAKGENIPVPLPKLRRMAVLWYILTIALGAAHVKNLFQSMNTAGTKDWVMSVLGLAVVGFSLFRIFKILIEKRGLEDGK